MRTRFLAALAAAGMALAACGGGGGEGPAAAEGGSDSGEVDPDGVVRIGYGLVGAATGGFTFVPADVGGQAGDLAIHHWIYGALMRPTPDGLVPDLASETTVVDDTTIEVVLREGLTFSDGTPLDAEAVARSLEHNLTLTDSRAFRAEFFDLEGVEVTDPTTVVLDIPNGTAASWHDLFMGSDETVILPPGMDPAEPVGAGPFVVTDYEPEQRLVLEKNPDYWDADTIRVAGIELINTPTPQAVDSALRAGQVDIARLDDYSLVQASDMTALIQPDPQKLAQLIVCKSDGPLADPQVRRALTMAIDRDAVNEALFGGEGLPAWGLWPEGHRFYDDELTGRNGYDPEAARELLEEAGYGDGFTVEVIPTQSALMPETAQIIQEQWDEVGVTLEIVNSSNFVDDFYVNGEAPLAAIPVTGEGIGRIDQYSGDGLSNTCDYHDPELEELSAQLRTVSATSDEAVEAWSEIQRIVVEDALGILVMFQPSMHLYDDDRLGDVAIGAYVIPVPDMWQLYVEA